MKNMTRTMTRFRKTALHIAIVVAALLPVLIGCDSSSLVDAGVSSGTVLEKGLSKNGPAPSQPVKLTSDPTQVVGESSIIRTKKGISYRIDTSELTPGDVVTVWTIIFNNPEYCDGPCNGADFSVPEVQADALYGGGRIIGGDGSATFAGHQRVGNNDGSIFPDYLGLPSPGLIDAEKAEIHFVLRSHGPKIEGLTSEMLHSYNAGCGPEFGGRPVPETLGTYGPNTCAHVQFVVHEGSE